MRTQRSRHGRLIGLPIVVLLTVACATSKAPVSTGERPSTNGVAVVTVDSAHYTFIATSCVVAVDVFVVEGADEEGATLLIRHASPPTRDPAEPGMSVFVVEAGSRWEAPPAAFAFHTYEPEVGRAGGSTPVNAGGPTGPASIAEFEVTCPVRSGG